MHLANVQTLGSQCLASKQSKTEIWLHRSQIYLCAQIEKQSFCMCSCVCLQRNHNFTERLRRKKLLRWFCFACKAKPFTDRPMRSCIAGMFRKKSQPQCPIHNLPKTQGASSTSTSIAKKYCIFYANNLLIAKFTQPTSHTSNIVDKWVTPKIHLNGLDQI
jgi:hypothetical protein